MALLLCHKPRGGAVPVYGEWPYAPSRYLRSVAFSGVDSLPEQPLSFFDGVRSRICLRRARASSGA